MVDLSSAASSIANTNKSVSNIKPELNSVVVEILSTPNGFLRVRSEPNTSSNEVAEVHQGEKYKFIKTDFKTGWYDIELSASMSGWISNVYAATSSGTLN